MEETYGNIMSYVQVNVQNGDHEYMLVKNDDKYNMIIVDLGNAGQKYNFNEILNDIDKYSNNEKMHISLFFTHLHNDHIGGITKFYEAVKDKVEIDNVYIPESYFKCYEIVDFLDKNTNIIINEESRKEDVGELLAWGYYYSMEKSGKAKEKVLSALEEIKAEFNRTHRAQINEEYISYIMKKLDKENLYNKDNENYISELFKGVSKIKTIGKEEHIEELKEETIYGIDVKFENFNKDEFKRVISSLAHNNKLRDFLSLDYANIETSETTSEKEKILIDEGKQIRTYIETNVKPRYLSRNGYQEGQPISQIKDKGIREIYEKYGKTKQERFFNKNIIDEKINKHLESEGKLAQMLIAHSWSAGQNMYNSILHFKDKDDFSVLIQGDCELLHEKLILYKLEEAQGKEDLETVKRYKELLTSDVTKDGHHLSFTSNVITYMIMNQYLSNQRGKNPYHIGSCNQEQYNEYTNKYNCSIKDKTEDLGMKRGDTCFNFKDDKKRIRLDADEFGNFKLQDFQAYEWLEKNAKTEEDDLFTVRQKRTGIDLKLYSFAESFEEYKSSVLAKEELKQELIELKNSLETNKREILDYIEDKDKYKNLIDDFKEIKITNEIKNNEILKTAVETYNENRKDYIEKQKVYAKGRPQDILKYQEKWQEKEYKSH